MRRRAFISLLALAPALAGCPEAATVLRAVSKGAAWLSTIIDTAESGAATYYKRHPNQEAEAQIADAVEKARSASNRLAAIADAATKQDALAAFLELKGLLADLGVLEALAPAGGAENTDADDPEPFDLPDEAEAAAHLEIAPR